MGVGDHQHAMAALPLGKSDSNNCMGGWVGPRASLDRWEEEKISSTGIQTPHCVASSQLLYQLCCPGHVFLMFKYYLC